MMPRSRPQQSRAETEAMLIAGGVDLAAFACALLGVRGYYRDTMGVAGVNDRGIYDDGLMLVSQEVYATFNGNTDPSARFRAGLACLRPGLWKYKVGIHGLSRPKDRQYTALVQDAPVTVARDTRPGAAPRTDTGYFGINIHRGGYGTTSSEGCQTVHPEQWDAFIALVRSELRRHDQKSLPYLLVENL